MELYIEFTEMEALKGFDIKGHEKASGINTNKMFNVQICSESQSFNVIAPIP